MKYVHKQLRDIRQGGTRVLGRKLTSLLRRLASFPMWLVNSLLAIPVISLMRLVRPWFIIRVGHVDLGRIGGIYAGDWYLSEKAMELHRGRYRDFFYFNKSTNHVNEKWLKMWKCALPFVPGSKFWRNMLRLNRLIPGYEKHEIVDQHVIPDLKTWQAHLRNPGEGKIQDFNDRLKAVLKNAKANVSFNAEEKEHGQSVLECLGIPKDKQYICFHARDSSYLDAVFKKRDWSYHNYRDSNIHNYIPTAEEMASRGYYAVRMGAMVRESIHCSHPRVIDHASNGHRTDFSDIYIGSHCRFFLCSDGGMSTIPEIFRVPAVYVNWVPILRISNWVLNGLFIFKKFYLKNENRCMNFLEIMNLEFGGVDTFEIFARLNLELIENTPEEIRAVTIEMDERLNGTWESTVEDKELQERFWALFGPDKLKSPNLRIGADFLRQNEELIC